MRGHNFILCVVGLMPLITTASAGATTTTSAELRAGAALPCANAAVAPQAIVPRQPIEIPASDFINGVNVALGSGHAAQWGTDTLLNGPPYTPRPNAAEWRVNVPSAGRYELWIRYAAAEPRPIEVLVNGNLMFPMALNAVTGCWTPDCRQWADIGTVNLNAGDNVIRFQRDNYFPHLNRLRLVPLF